MLSREKILKHLPHLIFACVLILALAYFFLPLSLNQTRLGGAPPSEGALDDVLREEITYKNYDDGYMVQATLYKLKNGDYAQTPGFVVGRGAGDITVQELKWREFTARVANAEYVALFPTNNRIYSDFKEKGSRDLYWGIKYLQSTYGVKKVGCMGSSQSNLATLQLVEDSPDECKAYVNLAGALIQIDDNNEPHNQYLLYDNNVARITAPTLMQVGEGDGQKQTNQEILLAKMRQNSLAPAYQKVYGDDSTGHGFFTPDADWPNKDKLIANDAQKDTIEFLNWVLKGENKPEWYDDGDENGEKK